MAKGYGIMFWKMLIVSLQFLLIAFNFVHSEAASLSDDEIYVVSQLDGLMFGSYQIRVYDCVSNVGIAPVDALRVIASKLGKKDWDFSADPCSGEGGWSTKDPMEGFENELLCNCTDENGCHVVSITLKSQNLSGVLPPELVRLPFLYNIDLTRNLLTGSIPPEWTALPLQQINLMANRLSGPIPKEIGNITTLQKLSLSSNNLTGELPVEMSKLTNLVDLILRNCLINGNIPEDFEDMNDLKILDLGFNDLTGNIPSSLEKLENLEKKILETYNRILFSILPYFTGRDLSFNNLTGNIPSSLEKLEDLDFFDLSYNNFTPEDSMPSECQLGNICLFVRSNLFASHSSTENSLSYYNCLEGREGTDKQKPQCKCVVLESANPSANEVNACSSGETVVGSDTYGADNNPQGASFFSLNPNWAFSTTGNFMGDKQGRDIPNIATNNSPIATVNPELYTTARTSPISLTYYGLHLSNRDYRVRLHFAEIIFTNESAFTGLARRFFDVYIQGKLVLKDFNIEDEAGGPGKPIVKSFMATVTNHTVEINFCWAGKGTQAIPRRGAYGVLVSAISVESSGAVSHGGRRLPGKVVAVIVVFVLLVACMALCAGIFLWKKKSNNASSRTFKNYR
ncbi:hypothetical protein ACLOJK_010710 [Asimina triloba]